MDLLVSPAGPLKGSVPVPGDKSITHRALIMGALAQGTTTVNGFLDGADCRATRRCLEALGVEIHQPRDGLWEILGRGWQGLKDPGSVLDAGNSGTTMRLLLGVLAACPFSATITGDASLQRRPMERVAEPLRRMGARIGGNSDGKYPPLTVTGGELRPVDYRMPVASAQVKSAVLLAALAATGTTRVHEPALSRDHTERMLGAFGARVLRRRGTVKVKGPQSLEGTRVEVPGDVSSAAFLLGAGLLVPGSRVRLEGVGTNPTRTGILDVLLGAGANLRLTENRVRTGEPLAHLEVEAGALSPFAIGGRDVPRLVDEVPLLALLATQATGTSQILQASELRVKESDRLAATARGLRSLGANVEELEDGLVIHGPAALRGAELDSEGDHRMAMTWAVAGLIASGQTLVRNFECVEISFPGFVQVLQALGGRIDGEETEKPRLA